MEKQKAVNNKIKWFFLLAVKLHRHTFSALSESKTDNQKVA